MKITSLFIAVMVCCSACNTGSDKQTGTASSSPDTSANITPALPAKDKIVLKEIILNDSTVFSKARLTAGALIKGDGIKELSLRELDAVNESSFKYYVYDTLFIGNSIKVLLIERQYTEENVVWLAVYDDGNRLINSKEVYYDNAEGFTAMSSVIKNNLIKITTTNDFAEKESKKKEVTTWQFDSDNKLVQSL